MNERLTALAIYLKCVIGKSQTFDGLYLTNEFLDDLKKIQELAKNTKIEEALEEEVKEIER